METTGNNTLNYDCSTVNALLAVVDENRGAFPVDTEPSAESGHAIASKAVYEAMRKVEGSTVKCKGYYDTEATLQEKHKVADTGCIAYVGTSAPYKIYEWGDNGWTDTGYTHTPEVDLGKYPTKAEMESIKTSTEQAADRAEKMESYTDAASKAADAANKAAETATAAAKKAEEAAQGTGLMCMEYKNDDAANQNTDGTKVAFDLWIPNVPREPKLGVFGIEYILDGAVYRTTITCHLGGNAQEFSEFFTLYYPSMSAPVKISMQINDYYQDEDEDVPHLDLFFTATKLAGEKVLFTVPYARIFY